MGVLISDQLLLLLGLLLIKNVCNNNLYLSESDMSSFEYESDDYEINYDGGERL